jgi:hypothetical protein
VISPSIRAGLIRAGLAAGGIALAASAVGRLPVPGAVRAAGMLALPCVLLAFLRREERRLADAAGRVRARPVRPPAPAAPARRRR